MRGDGLPVGDNYIIADNPVDAVEKAVAAALARTDETQNRRLLRTPAGGAQWLTPR